MAELWLIDHLSETAEICRRSTPNAPAFDERLVLGSGDTLTTPLLPGLALDVATLLAQGADL